MNQPGGYPLARNLFLLQPAMIIDAEMPDSSLYSFAYEVWQDAGEATFRCMPSNFEHSIARLCWHIARIEDTTRPPWVL